MKSPVQPWETSGQEPEGRARPPGVLLAGWGLRLAQLLFLYKPGPPAQHWHHPQVCWYLTHQSVTKNKCSPDLPTGWSDKGLFLIEVSSSLTTLTYIKFTKTNKQKQPPHLSAQCYFFPFLQKMDWRVTKCCPAGLAGGGAPRAGALLLSCAVRSPAPAGPAAAGPPAVATAAAAAAASALWPRPPRAPSASPRRPPASPASAGVGSGPCACLPRPLPSPGVLLKGRGRACAGEGED